MVDTRLELACRTGGVGIGRVDDELKRIPGGSGRGDYVQGEKKRLIADKKSGLFLKNDTKLSPSVLRRKGAWQRILIFAGI
jgi:hypothetical protein